MSGQLTLDMGEAYPDPDTCPHGRYYPNIDRTLCVRGGRETWVTCHAGRFGEPPRCADAPPDNSPEVVARRLAWMEGDR